MLYKDFLPEDFTGHLETHMLDGTILVQAAPTFEETLFLFDLADRSKSILGVVGWLDLFDSSHIEYFQWYKKHPKFVGFRIMIQDMPNAEKILEPKFIDALKIYEKLNVPIDLLVTSDQLDAVVQLLEKVPNIRGVIDHIGKPKISAQLFEQWENQMKQIAGYPNIYCKLSGMVTEADHQSWKPEHIKPYIEYIIRIFGKERIMFGSDWPVCLLAASYDEVVELLESAIPSDWTEEDTVKLFGENAMNFYKLMK